MKLVKYNIFINILIYAFVKINRIHTYLQVRKYIIIQDLIPIYLERYNFSFTLTCQD